MLNLDALRSVRALPPFDVAASNDHHLSFHIEAYELEQTLTCSRVRSTSSSPGLRLAERIHFNIDSSERELGHGAVGRVRVEVPLTQLQPACN